MKYIERKYQQLIQDIESAYDDTCSTLKYHIDELKKMLAEKDDEIEKLKGASQLQKEIDEYNRLEAQNNMNLEDEIVELKAENIKLEAENKRLKKAYSDLEKAYKLTVEPASYRLGDEVVVHHCDESKPKVYKKRSKTVVARCKDCGTYFQAKSKNARYCSACGKKRAKQSRLKWLAKQKGQK